MSRLTKEQLAVVNAKTSNIIVSAAAGSGKTSVLAARVIDLIKNRHYHLDELVVITFTNLAAKEIKDRIIKELSNDDSLKEELSHIEEAHIQTFDSFCSDFIAKFQEYTLYPSNFQIGDYAMFNMKESEYMNIILDDFFENTDVDILDQFIEFFQNEKESISKDGIKKRLIEYYEKVINIYDHREYLNRFIDDYLNDNKVNNYISLYLKKIRSKVQFIIDLNFSTDNAFYNEQIDSLYEDINSIMDIEDDFEFIDKLSIYKIPRLKSSTRYSDKISSEETKRFREFFKNIIDEVKLKPLYIDKESIINDVNRVKNIFEIIKNILIKLDDMMMEFKVHHKLFDFLDIEKECIKILSNNKDVSDYYKTKIKEILIDECQDTNSINELLVEYISNNNVLRVGDIKQSIYRFRNAEPQLFQSKIDEYLKNGNGSVFFLTKNFRSRKNEVIDQVNFFFKNIYSYNTVDMPYLNQFLVYGNTLYDSNSQKDHKLRYIPYNKKEKLAEYSIIVNDIKERINNSIEVLDKETGLMRKARYSDFLILSSSNDQVKDIAKVLTKAGVPTKSQSNEGFFVSEEIKLIKNLTKSIYYYSNDKVEGNDEKLFNISLLSVLRSYAFQTSDDIIQTYLNRTEYSNNKEALKSVLPSIFELFENASKLLKETNIYKVLSDIVVKYPIYKNLTRLNDVEKREVKINLILERIKIMATSMLTLEDIINYFDFLDPDKMDVDVSTNDFLDLDCVNVMTIHKSKGLEKPLLYLVNLGNTRQAKPPIFNKNYGFFYGKKSSMNSILDKLMLLEEVEESRREDIRLLYVALTRARESISLLIDENTLSFKGPLTDANSLQKILLMNNDLSDFVFNKYNDQFIESDFYADDDKLNPPKLIYKDIVFKEKQEVIMKHASHELESEDELKLFYINEGTRIHSLFEKVNFLNDIEVEIQKYNISDKDSKYIRQFKNQFIFNTESIKEYHELQYILDDFNGIIDFVLEKKDKFIIVDFKFKNIDSSYYVDQLHAYKDYLSSRSNKPIETYLYSIINNELKKID